MLCPVSEEGELIIQINMTSVSLFRPFLNYHSSAKNKKPSAHLSSLL